MIVRETRRKGGVREERVVDYSTGKVLAETKREQVADPWANHHSLGMGARTNEHAQEIRDKCRVAGVSCQFDKSLNLKVNSMSHQRKLMKVLGCHNLQSYY